MISHTTVFEKQIPHGVDVNPVGWAVSRTQECEWSFEEKDAALSGIWLSAHDPEALLFP